MAEVVILLLILLILGREYLSYKERKDLYNRLMARNLEEVMEIESSKPPADIPLPDDMPSSDYIPVEELSDDAFDEIIQADLNQETSVREKAISKLKRKAK